MFSSIRRQLMIGFIGLAITPLLLAGLVSSSANFRAQEQQALALQRAIAQRFSSEINLFIGQIENELRQLTRVGNFTTLTTQEQTALLSELLSYQDGLESAALLDAHGLEQARVERIQFVNPSDTRDWSQADEFLRPTTTGRPYYSPLISDEATGEPLMNLAYPLTNLRSGKVEGVMIGEIRFKKVWDLLRDSNTIEGEEIYVLDTRNYVVAHPSPSVVLHAGGTSFNLPREHGITTGLDGDTVVMAWDEMPLGEQILHVVAEQPVSEALELAYHTLYVTGGLLAGALIVAGIAGALTVRQIVTPIERLAATAQKIASGDLSQRAQTESAAEIEALADSFNSMTTQLVTTMDGLEKLNADLERRVKDRTAQLQSANSRLTELDHLKTLFIQDMSHELRTPLSILSTSLYLLERKPERSAEYLQKIKDQITRLTQLANSTLELSRLEQQYVVFEPVSLNEIVEEVTSPLKVQAESTGLTFTVNLDSSLSAIQGDREQLTQVVKQLVTNAIKYTQVGSIDVSTNADTERACLTIRDTGRGIMAEDIPHLFERFYRGKGVGSSTISGSGLGLAIVKGIVDLHQGSIEVESTVDVGTTFRLWLPLAKESPS
jgi:two-component system, sensor histidine kinase ChiS